VRTSNFYSVLLKHVVINIVAALITSHAKAKMDGWLCMLCLLFHNHNFYVYSAFLSLTLLELKDNLSGVIFLNVLR
jgi:hypothetical protein